MLDRSTLKVTLLLTLTLPSTVTHALDAKSALNEAANCVSSFFLNHPTPTQSNNLFCCGDSCPPGACDLNRIIPTDLLYAYPAPTAPATATAAPSSQISFPCCGASCADGACRTTPIDPFVRPAETSGSHRRGANLLNAIVGCDMKVIPATTTSLAKVNDVLQKRALEVRCIGCHPCSNCGRRKRSLLSWATFTPNIEATHHASTAAITGSLPAATAMPEVVTPTTSVGQHDASSPQQTVILGNDITSAVQGKNQDVLPIIFQSDNVLQGENESKELVTILTTIDLKLAENYISRRVLALLSRLKEAVPHPEELDSTTAVLQQDLTVKKINATILLDIVAGAGEVRNLFTNVRFSVWGEVEDTELKVPDVIMGSKFLREAGGLTVYPKFRGTVEDGVKVLGPVHLDSIRL